MVVDLAQKDQRLQNGLGNTLKTQRIRVQAVRTSTTTIAETNDWKRRWGKAGVYVQVSFIWDCPGESSGMCHTHNTQSQRLTRKRKDKDGDTGETRGTH